MQIKYIGHSCFLITLESGIKIITDPYDNTVGYDPVDESADYVLVSHNHFDHSFCDGINGDYTVISKPGTYDIGDCVITGLEQDHDSSGGEERGKVVTYKIEAEGISLLHMGDVGCVPDGEYVSAVGKVDILMVPVGGVYTVDAEGAFEIMEKIQPNVTIPMHYMTTSLKFAIKGVHEFEAVAGSQYDISRRGHSLLEVNRDKLKKRSRIIIMEHSN